MPTSITRLIAITFALLLACLAPSNAHAQSCTPSGQISSFPFTPGVNNPFGPGDSRVTNSTFTGASGDVLTFQANPGGANSRIRLVRASNNATIIATITISASGAYTIGAGDLAAFPYQIEITNNSAVNQTYVIDCNAAPPAPNVTAISPNSGTTAGGTSVTITGSNLSGATAVVIGGVAATGVNVVSATSVIATTGAHAAGAVNVAITTPGGTGTGTGLFTYVAPPAAPIITAITPSSGSTAGGTAVTITGANFTGATAVIIGAVPAASFTVVSDTTIAAITGARAAGLVGIGVTTPAGTGTRPNIFTYVAPTAVPTITSVSPVNGPAAGGTTITITGANFTGASAVTVGGAAATGVTVVSDTTITATTGAHAAGVVDVAVTTPGGTGTGAGLFTYVTPIPAPSVTAISPNSGSTAGGSDVTITGTGFNAASAVSIGGTPATGVNVIDATTITATTPAHSPGIADVSVTGPGGTGIGPGLFTFVAPPGAPTVTAVSPASGANTGGTVVTITGTNFTGATAVSFGAVAATNVTVASATSITATTSAHAAGVVDVTVTAPGGTGTGTGLFTYVAPPAAPIITAITPSSGSTAGGTAVTITGANFTGATAVVIGAVPAASFIVVSDTTITAITSARAAGVVGLGVTTPAGTGTRPGIFTYVSPPVAPTITAVSPGNGATAGGTIIAVSGANLTGATSVSVGGVAVTSFTVANDTTITATTGAHAPGVVDVAVTTVGGTGTGVGLFTYVAQATPTIAVIAPNSGSTAGGTAVTITGVNFTGATAVTVGGAAAAGVVVVSDTTITATTGAHAAGVVDVTVTTPSGAGTGTGLYTYVTPPAAPTITAIVPASGSTAGGTTITITGANFAGATSVTVGGASASDVAVVNDTTITAKTPAHAAGVVDVAVATPAGSGSGVQLYTYVAPVASLARTVEAIGGFLARRNDLIASNQPDTNRQIDRLIEAGGIEAGNSAGSRMLGNRMAMASHAPAFTEPSWPRSSDMHSVGNADWEADFGAARGATNWRDRADLAPTPTRFEFATSLRALDRRSTNVQARRAAGAGFDLSTRQTSASRANPFDLWVEGRYARFGDDRSSADLDGHFTVLTIGTDYVVAPKLLVGAMVQFDSMSQRSDAQAIDVEGRGWLAGPYATVRLGDALFWNVRAAWGRSSNHVSPFLTYTDEFESKRWLVSSQLTGSWSAGPWLFRPSASVFYIEDTAQSYTDAVGVDIPEVTSRLGQLRAGPEVSYRYERGDISLEPHASAQVSWNFAGDTTASGFNRIGGDFVARDGARARVEAGLRATTRRGLNIDLSASYDGVGSDQYHASAISLRLSMPLN